MSKKVPQKVPKKRGRKPIIDVAEALRLRLVHKLPYSTIASYYGVSDRAVRKALKRFLDLLEAPEVLEEYENVKAQLLSSAEMMLLNEIVRPEKLKKASVNNLAYAFERVFNANRLERGKSTQNISYAELTKEIEELEKAIAEYEKTTVQSIETVTDKEAI